MAPPITPVATGNASTETPEIDNAKRKRQPRNSACQACATLKMKCVGSPIPGVCERYAMIDCIRSVIGSESLQSFHARAVEFRIVQLKRLCSRAAGYGAHKPTAINSYSVLLSSAVMERVPVRPCSSSVGFVVLAEPRVTRPFSHGTYQAFSVRS